MALNIQPVANPGIPANTGDAQADRVTDVRRITMNTNATPDFASTPADSATADPLGQTPVPSEETKPLSPQLAALAKQRRALQVKERELAERERALSSGSSTKDAWINPADLQSQPLSVLLSHGVTYDQLTEAILADRSGINPELQALKAEIKALKEGVDKSFTDRDSQAEQQVLAEMKREVTQLAQTGDDFELVRETGSIPDVMTLIERTYRETGEVLEVREALSLIENELISESLKIARMRKVQSQLQPVQQPKQQQRQQMTTLTNRDDAKPQLSAKQRALAAFHGTLKK